MNRYKLNLAVQVQSIERGKPTEIDYLNGYIVRKGKGLSASVPVNTIIVSMIHEIELNKRAISVNNFNDPFFERFN